VPTILFNSGDAAGALRQTPLEELRALPRLLAGFNLGDTSLPGGVARISVWEVRGQRSSTKAASWSGMNAVKMLCHEYCACFQR